MNAEQELSKKDEALLLAWHPYQLLLQMVEQRSLSADDFGECYIVSVSLVQLLVGMQAGPFASPLQTLLTYCRMARQLARRHFELFLTYHIPHYIQTLSWAQLSNPLVMNDALKHETEELIRAYRIDQSDYYQKHNRLYLIHKAYCLDLELLFSGTLIDCSGALDSPLSRMADRVLLELVESGFRAAIQSAEDPADRKALLIPAIPGYHASKVRGTVASVELAKLPAKDCEYQYQFESLLGFVEQVVAPSISRALGMADHYLCLGENAQGKWIIQSTLMDKIGPTQWPKQALNSCGLCNDLVRLIESYWLLPCQRVDPVR